MPSVILSTPEKAVNKTKSLVSSNLLIRGVISNKKGDTLIMSCVDEFYEGKSGG